MGDLLCDRRQGGRHILAACSKLEGHLRLGRIVAKRGFQVVGGVRDIGRKAGLVPDGARRAQSGERDTLVTKIWLQVRGADAALQARLKEIAKSLPGTELRECQ